MLAGLVAAAAFLLSRASGIRQQGSALSRTQGKIQ